MKPWRDESDCACGTGSGPACGAGTAAAGADVTSGAGAGGTGTTAGAGASLTEMGPTGPGRRPGMPNCRDSTTPCSSRETSTPIASRRSDASRDEAGRAAVALGMRVVTRLGLKDETLPK